MKIEYATRPADSYDATKSPGATEIVKLWNRKVVMLMGVFESYAVAEKIAATLNEHAEFQIR